MCGGVHTCRAGPRQTSIVSLPSAGRAADLELDAPLPCAELLLSIAPHRRIPFKPQAFNTYVACTLREFLVVFFSKRRSFLPDLASDCGYFYY